jgi:hypothetical protein
MVILMEVANTIDKSSLELPFITSSIGINQFPLPMKHIIQKLPLILGPIPKHHPPFALHHALNKIPHIKPSIWE